MDSVQVGKAVFFLTKIELSWRPFLPEILTYTNTQITWQHYCSISLNVTNNAYVYNLSLNLVITFGTHTWYFCFSFTSSKVIFGTILSLTVLYWIKDTFAAARQSLALFPHISFPESFTKNFDKMMMLKMMNPMGSMPVSYSFYICIALKAQFWQLSNILFQLFTFWRNTF